MSGLRASANACSARANALEKCGELAAALLLADRIAQLAPLQESACRRQMSLRYLRGDRAGAIDAFERFEARLKDHTAAPLSQATRDLLTTIATNAAPRAGGGAD